MSGQGVAHGQRYALFGPNCAPVGIQAGGIAAGAAFFVVASVGKLGVVQVAPRRTQAHFAENALRAAAGVVARDIGVVVQNGGKAGSGDGVAVFLQRADSGGFQVGLPFEGGGEIKGLRGGIVFCLQAGDSGEFEPCICTQCGCAVLNFRHNAVFACFGSFCVGQGNAVGAQRFGACIQHAVTRHEGFDTVAYAAVDFDLRVNGQPCLLVGSRCRLRQDVLSRRGQGVETQHQRGTQPRQPCP